MIASLTGTVAKLRLDSAVIDVSGIGYLVFATPATLSSLRLGEQVTVATSLVVREDSLTLYGFADDDERAIFETVQTVSGVGPRLALAMLAVHTPDGVRRAVDGEDLAALQRVPGIGKKGAQRLVLELAGKLGEITSPVAGDPETSPTQGADEHVAGSVVDALVSLGWSEKLADEAVAAVRAGAGSLEGEEVSEVLRLALQVLGGYRG